MHDGLLCGDNVVWLDLHIDPVDPQISRPFIVSEIMNITKENAWQVQLMSIDPRNRYYIYNVHIRLTRVTCTLHYKNYCYEV